MATPGGANGPHLVGSNDPNSNRGLAMARQLSTTSAGHGRTERMAAFEIRFPAVLRPILGAKLTIKSELPNVRFPPIADIR